MKKTVPVASVAGLGAQGLVLALSAMLWASAAYAVTMYKWVDESGATHVSDKVPEKYKASAKAIDSRANEPSVPERRPSHAEPPQRGPVPYRVDQMCPNMHEAMASMGYPRAAKEQHITDGQFVVEFTVSVEGRVENVVIKEASHEIFARAGLDFARSLRCSPQDAPRRVTYPFGFHDRT